MRLELTPPSEELKELLSAFRLLSARAGMRPGCLGSNVGLAGQRHRQVIYQEVWNSWDELEEYIRSDGFLQILQLMELSARKPMLSFEGTDITRGLEWVQSVRSTKEPPLGRV